MDKEKINSIGVGLLCLGVVLAAIAWFSIAIISAKVILVVNLSGAMLLIFGQAAGTEESPVLERAKHEFLGMRQALLLLLWFLFFLFWVSGGHLLGYDIGIYRYLFNGYIGSLPSLDYSSLPEWAVVGHDPGQHILGAVLSLYGFSVDWVLDYLYPFASWLVGLGVYLLARRLWNERTGFLALGFYVLSASTLYAFQLFYFKTMFGMFLLLLLFLVIERKGIGPASVLLLAGIAGYHKPDLVVAVPLVVAYGLLKREWKNSALNLGLSAILVLGLYYSHLWNYLRMGVGSFGGAGTFFSQQSYEWFSVLYLPFVILGFYFLAFNRRYLFAGIFALVLVIVTGKVVFYNRFIVPLDIFASIAAGAGAFWLLENRKKEAFVLILLTLGLTAYFTFSTAFNTGQLLDKGQVTDIGWLSGNTEEDSYVIATSFDAPWVIGWSNRKVLAPGMFQWSDWDRRAWMGFLGGDSSASILDNYSSPVYLYFSKTQSNYWVRTEKFSGQCFSKVLDTGGSLIVKYERDSCKQGS